MHSQSFIPTVWCKKRTTLRSSHESAKAGMIRFLGSLNERWDRIVKTAHLLSLSSENHQRIKAHSCLENDCGFSSFSIPLNKGRKKLNAGSENRLWIYENEWKARKWIPISLRSCLRVRGSFLWCHVVVVGFRVATFLLEVTRYSFRIDKVGHAILYFRPSASALKKSSVFIQGQKSRLWWQKN